MFFQTTVGPQANLNGTNANQRGGRSGELSVADAHGRYQEASTQGKLYFCCNSAAQALSLTGTTTYTGLVVFNPPAPTGQGVNLVILEAAFAPTIAETGVGGVILFGQAIAATTPALTATNVAGMPSAAVFTGAAGGSAAKVASSCTLAANPIFMRPLIGIPWVTATAQAALLCKDEIAGSIVIPPGAGIGFVAVTTAITGIGYISWEEVPV